MHRFEIEILNIHQLGWRLNDVALREHTSEIRDVTCHMGSPPDTGERVPP